MVGFEGTTLNAETEDLIRNHHIGGLILFGRNYENPEQLHHLIQDLQAVAQSSPSGLPLFISVDQEGGKVARLKTPFTDYPSLCCLGEAESKDLAYRFARALARELSDVGINMDYAPVLDVHTNPQNPIIGDRAFSTDPEWTAQLGIEFLRGFKDEGMIPVGKHFPGHGDTLLDSHLDLPYVERPAEILEAVELLPFRKTIACGLPVIMTAHVIYTAWDSKLPATFSPKILQNLLRKELGFEGIIISDDLEMKAVEKHYSFDAFPRMGVEAGVDVFLICHDQEKIRALHERLTREVETGAILHARINASVDRITALKQQIKPPPVESPDPTCWQEDHRRLAEEMRSHLPVNESS